MNNTNNTISRTRSDGGNNFISKPGTSNINMNNGRGLNSSMKNPQGKGYAKPESDIKNLSGYNIITHAKDNKNSKEVYSNNDYYNNYIGKQNKVIYSGKGYIVNSPSNRNINKSSSNSSNQVKAKQGSSTLYLNSNQERTKSGAGTGTSQGVKNVQVDNLFISYKNAPLNNPINLNNSLDTRVNYSQSLQHRGNTRQGNGLSNDIFKKTNTNLSNSMVYNKIPTLCSKNEDYNNNCMYDQKQSQNKSVNATVFNASAKSVREYAYKEERNPLYRPAMEDFCKIIDRFMGDPGRGLFTLYDGHGGAEPVKYVKDRMPEVFTKFLKDTNNIEKAFIFSFQKVDDELKVLSDSENAGTTACIVYISRENDIIVGCKRSLFCANVGDTRCILISSNEVKRLSYDHKCIDEPEANRIRKVGGVVFNGRMFGQLALSRALGDHAMKKHGVIATPCVIKHTISDRDKWVVMCSDGVWDVLTDNDIFDLSLNCYNADELSDLIVRKAIDNGSRDNISCITIKLN